MAGYGAQNILRGMSITQIQDIMNRAGPTMTALLSGSLYVALDELSKVQTDSTVITAAVVTDFRRKIQDYLGMPRT
jgi:hypothetical protein